MTPFQAWYDSELTDSIHAVTKLSDLLLSHQAWSEREGHEPLDLPDLRAALIKKGLRIGRQGVRCLKIR